MTTGFSRCAAGAALAGLLSLSGCETPSTLGFDSKPNKEGGSVLDRLGLSVCTPDQLTFECFEGKFVVLAGDPNNRGPFTPPPPPKREPRTILYADPALDFSGGVERKDVDSAPIDIAGSRIHALAMEAYLDGLLQKLLKGSPAPPPPMKVFVVANPFYSASAYPSGDIFVNIGLLKDAQTEDEVAAMLAHEASHVLLSHFDRAELLERQEDVAQAVVAGATLVSAFQNGGAPSVSGGAPSFGAALGGGQPTLGGNSRAIYAVQAATFLAQDVIGTAWKRKQEDEADLLGLDLLMTAGYNVKGSVVNFQRLAEATKQRDEELKRLEERDTELESQLAANPSLSGLIGAFQNVLGNALEGGLKDARDWFRREHLDPEKRREDVTGYYRREWSELRPDQSTGPFAAAKAQSKIDQLFTDYRKVADAKTALALGNAAEAETLLMAALNGSVGSDPYPRVLQAQILQARGRPQEALAALGKIRRGASLSLDGYMVKASLEVAANQADPALATLDRGAALYGEKHFYPARLPALAAKGDRAALDAVYETCQKVGERAIRSACSEERDKLKLAGDGPRIGESMRNSPVGGALESVGDALGGLFGGGGASAPAETPQ